MIKEVKICDKCGEEQSRLYPFYKMRIEAFDTKVDKVENSLCRDCMKDFIVMQHDWMLGHTEEKTLGSWLDGGDYFVCSNCQRKQSIKTKYCADCGEKKGAFEF